MSDANTVIHTKEESDIPSPIKAKKPIYLEGPQSRSFELKFAWKVFSQILKGNRALYFVGPCITVFGSARVARTAGTDVASSATTIRSNATTPKITGSSADC